MTLVSLIEHPTYRAISIASFASAAALGLFAARVVIAENIMFAFLVWNLFLAWIPFVAALNIQTAFKHSRWLAGLTFGTWLLFFPNAPYLVTDFMHLRNRAPVPIVFDAVLLLAFALVGLMLGFDSLQRVQKAIAGRFGAFVGWCFVPVALGLCGIGIYVGRFLRWNSWDVLMRPTHLLAETRILLHEPERNPLMIPFIAASAVALLIGYVFVVSLRDWLRLEDTESSAE